MKNLISTAVLLEGIAHIEDLPLDDFIRAVENLKDHVITEKLDGANLWFGVDEKGIFTSREGKSKNQPRFYDVSDYSMVANYDAFRAAHSAIESMSGQIQKILAPGDLIEIEVIFGRQPNTVIYGANNSNYIVLLRPVETTSEETFSKLSRVLNGKETKVKSTTVISPDGESLEYNDIITTWKFVKVKPIDSNKIKIDNALAKLKEMKAFLKKKNQDLPNMSNYEVATLSLTSIPKDQRESAKAAREKINAILLNEFKLPIKELLLSDFVRKVKPMLQGTNINPEEDAGIEGVVACDKVTGDQIKIVDRDVFTTINNFNQTARNAISGLVKTKDQDAPIEMRGGVFGQAKIRIANLLGADELALSAAAKRFLSKFKKGTPQETAENVAKSLNIHNFRSVKTKILAILKSTIDDINSILDSFKKEAGEYKLVLKTGKQIRLSSEVMKRTLTAAAETKKEIREIIDLVERSKTVQELLLALYGRTFNSLFNGETFTVNESFNLIKRLVSEEDGTADGAPATTNGAESAAQSSESNPALPSFTSSVAIAPVEKRIFGGKVIMRRKRNFKKLKKFSLPSKTNESLSLLKSVVESSLSQQIDNVAGIDNETKAENDIEFKQLRNMVNMGDNVNHQQVVQYLKKAHELNDEVDSIIFGMELDDGKIVKVYVNADQADGFEKALSELLGKEDDIEKVINMLADKFDIVDVEWPENYENDKSDSNLVEPQNDSDENQSNEVEDEEDKEDKKENSEEDGIDFEILNSNDDEDEDEEEEDEDEDDEDEEEEDEDEDDEDEEEEDEDEDDEDEVEGSKKSINAKTNQESHMLSLGELFKQRILSEKQKNDGMNDLAQDNDEELQSIHDQMPQTLKKLLNSLPSRGEKAVVMLMYALGAPIDALILKRAELRKKIQESGEHYLKDSQFRMWAKKLIQKFMNSQVSDSSGVVGESLLDQLPNIYQKMIYSILNKLGMPESIEKIAKNALRKSIKEKADFVELDSEAFVYLRMVADNLGIDIHNISSSLKTESATDDERKIISEDAGSDFIEEVMEIVKSFGIDETDFKNISAVALKIRRNRAAMISDSKIKRAMKLLKAAIEEYDAKNVRRGASLEQESVKTAEKNLTGNDIIQELLESKDDVVDGSPVDIGKWNIANLKSNGLMIKNKSISIKLDTEQAKKLVIALTLKQPISVKARDDKKYIFTPIKGKKNYSVKEADDEITFPNGVLVSAEDVKKIIEIAEDF